jgi:hypothetical protein
MLEIARDLAQCRIRLEAYREKLVQKLSES